MAALDESGFSFEVSESSTSPPEAGSKRLKTPSPRRGSLDVIAPQRRSARSASPSLAEARASAAAFSVNVLLALDVHVGILDPGHNLFVGAHIGTEAINSSSNKALLDELHGVLTGDSLNLGKRVLSGVNLDSTLGTTEGDIGDSKLEGHEGGEGLDFLKIDVIGVASTTLDGELMS